MRLNYSILILLFLISVFVSFTACERDDDFDIREITVTGFSPIAALGGDTISIVGSGYSEDLVLNVVEFSGSALPATVLSASPDQLDVVVPDDALAGVVKVIIGVNSAASNVPFLLSPSIGSVNPDAALPGEQIIIQGRNFTTNLDKLAVVVGQVYVDSLFGGSSNQIVFPLPLNLPVGPTKIKVGTILAPGDTVFAPGVDFIVLDPERPTITDIFPRTATPGTLLTLFGNAFKTDPDSITVDFGSIQIDEFVNLESDEIQFVIPEDLPVSGVETIDITVTVINSEGESLKSDPAIFNLVEPSDLLFYYTALNSPGFQNSEDDSIYLAEPISGGNALKTALRQTNRVLGIDTDLAENRIYYFGSDAIQQANDDGTNEELVIDLNSDPVPISDLAYSKVESIIYYPSREQSLINAFNLNTRTSSTVESIPSGFDVTPVENIKRYENYLLWTEGKTVVRYNLNTNERRVLYQTSGDLLLIAVATDGTNVYIVEGPSRPSIFNNTPGDSRIYKGNIEGSGSLTVLYNRPGEVITDLELSSDGETLYWMSSANNGGILSAPSSSGNVATVISGIRNGRYLKVIRKE